MYSLKEISTDFDSNKKYIVERPIRLADVLAAIQNKQRVRRDTLDFAKETNWNLRDNNLDHQSDECKEFLIKLLVK